VATVEALVPRARMCCSGAKSVAPLISSIRGGVKLQDGRFAQLVQPASCGFSVLFDFIAPEQATCNLPVVQSSQIIELVRLGAGGAACLQ
jgi:hypothetical protein